MDSEYVDSEKTEKMLYLSMKKRDMEFISTIRAIFHRKRLKKWQKG